MRVRRLLTALTVVAASALVVSPAAAALALPAPAASSARASTSGTPQARQIAKVVRATMRENDLKAVVLGVQVGKRQVVTRAFGNSMTGVPASTRMHFRNGNVAIAYLTTILLRLQDRGRLSADDKLSNWFPGLPEANRITLRMLANSTSGYSDYVRSDAFATALDANPFRRWTPRELIRIGTSRINFPPGTSFDYSHTGFVILGEVLRRATGTSVARLIRQHILTPLRLRNTQSSQTARIPAPVLHAYSAERGTYEESTFWNPSWGTARGANMTTTIADMATSSRAIGTGRLLSRRAHREQVGPATAGVGGNTREVYYAMGMPVLGGWIIQNPSLAGFGVMAAYLPSKRITIAVVSTKGERSEVDTNFSGVITRRIAKLLAPRKPLPESP
jgi:D-alanyl-D-alanine carboxypeptidase